MSTDPINAGQVISFRAHLSPSQLGLGTFSISKYCNLSGNCMSLLYGNDAIHRKSVPSNAFYRLFYNCDKIYNVSENFLPATVLGEGCYEGMFYGCGNLESAPKLPATTLAYGCYSSMFAYCRRLTVPPVLPATKLAGYCYAHMFQSCDFLTTAPELPATNIAESCYMSMFTLCKRLETAPVLPAKKLDYHCYYGMFSGCSNLNYIKMLATEL